MISFGKFLFLKEMQHLFALSTTIYSTRTGARDIIVAMCDNILHILTESHKLAHNFELH